MAFFRRRGCKCWQKKCTCGASKKTSCTCGASKAKIKKCTCGAKWEYIIEAGVNPKNGRRKQISKGGFNTKDEAEKEAAVVEYELLNKTYIQESNINFKDFSKQWKENYAVVNEVKDGTLRIRQHEIDKLMPYFECLPLKDIKKRDYQKALNDLKAKGFAENTISGVHTTAGMIFRQAIEWEHIKNDPTKGAKVPKDKLTVEEIENKEEIPKYLEKEELALFLKTAKKLGLENDYEIFMVLAYTGMRVGELCALKRTDLDFDTLSITKTLYNPNNNRKKYKLVPPKTKKSIRDITVENEITDLLTKLISKQKVIKMKHRNIYHDKGFIFAYSEDLPGYPYYIKFIENRMARLLKLAGLNQELTPHSLRHTHVSLLAEAGVSLPDIMDRLGHEDDETTRLVYLHVTKTKKKEASQKFSELMRNL